MKRIIFALTLAISGTFATLASAACYAGDPQWMCGGGGNTGGNNGGGNWNNNGNNNGHWRRHHNGNRQRPQNSSNGGCRAGDPAWMCGNNNNNSNWSNNNGQTGWKWLHRHHNRRGDNDNNNNNRNVTVYNNYGNNGGCYSGDPAWMCGGGVYYNGNGNPGFYDNTGAVVLGNALGSAGVQLLMNMLNNADREPANAYPQLTLTQLDLKLAAKYNCEWEGMDSGGKGCFRNGSDDPVLYHK